MKKFSIRYQGQSGQEEFKEFVASSSDEAEQMAKIQGILPLEISEISEEGPGIMAWFQGGISLPELFHFTRLLGTLTRAGLPILEAIDTIREKMPNPRFRRTLDKIYTDIQGGTTLAAAFASHPGVFDFTYQNLIKVGEESGEIGQVLGRLVGMLDRQIRLRRAIRRALTYPVLVMVISGLVTYAILTYIVPRFKDIYKRFGGDLPGLTKVTMAVSDFLVNHTPIIVCFLILIFLGFKILIKTQIGKRLYDYFLLSLPLLGPMYHTYEIAQLSKSFSILIHSGVTVTSSLEILVPAVSREPIKDSLLAANESIRGGKSMGDSFSEQEPWMPDLFNRMVTVGERSGNLTEMLDHISEFYEEEFHNRVETLASLIEPMMIIFLGVIIGGIVISLYLPIFGMAKLIARR